MPLSRIRGFEKHALKQASAAHASGHLNVFSNWPRSEALFLCASTFQKQGRPGMDGSLTRTSDVHVVNAEPHARLNADQDHTRSDVHR